MSILKALKRQAGKPFRVMDNIPLVEGFDHYSYKRDITSSSSSVVIDEPYYEEPTDQHVDTQGVLEVCEELHVDQHMAEEDQHVEEVITSEVICEPPEEVSVGPDLAACMANGFQSVVTALAAIKPVPATIAPVMSMPSLVDHTVKPQPPRMRKHRVKVTNRDANGNIDTIDIQEY